MKKINLFGENGILSGKRVFLFTCCSAVLLTGVTSVAASGNIKSQGVITYDNHTVDPSDDVFFDASDLTMLETEIQTATDAAVQGKNDLVDKLKEKLPSSVTDGLGDNPTYDEIADAIGNIGKGANFTADELLEGKIGYDGTNLVTGTMPNKGAFTSSGLLAGESVTIPKGFHNGSGFVQAASLASQTGVTGTYTNTHDTEDTSDDTVEDLVAATADNLSLGTAAWVDGQYIVGNGADNNSYYNYGISQSSTKYSLGKANQYDIKALTGLSDKILCSLTESNFIVEIISIPESSGSTGSEAGTIMWTFSGTGCNISKSYDNTTYILSLSGTSQTISLTGEHAIDHYAHGNYGKTQTINYNVYLVI